jgi:hypothetical protein
MARVTVKFGGDEISKSGFNTVGEVLESTAVRTALGFEPGRVQASIDGAVVSGSTVLEEDDEIVLTAVASTKG